MTLHAKTRRYGDSTSSYCYKLAAATDTCNANFLKFILDFEEDEEAIPRLFQQTVMCRELNRWRHLALAVVFFTID